MSVALACAAAITFAVIAVGLGRGGVEGWAFTGR
jgi:hypothetical protein